MPVSVANSEPKRKFPKKWVWAVRLLATAAWFAQWYVYDPGDGSNSVAYVPVIGGWRILIALVPIAFWSWTLWRLRDITAHKGVALSLGTGLWSTIVYILVLIFTSDLPRGALHAMAVLSVSLVLVASLTFRRLPVRHTLTLVISVPVTLIWFISFVWSSAMLTPHDYGMTWSDLQARGSIRNIAECAILYADEHPDKGFPVSLKLLGPEGSQCIHHQGLLKASGAERIPDSDYLFQYQPGVRDSRGKIPMFRIEAWPAQPNGIWKRSFLAIYSVADRNLRWHTTDEYRPATKDDPPI